jgi:hypothetical protein
MKKRELLPPDYHMVIAEMNGRYYPLRTDETSTDTAIVVRTSPQVEWQWLLHYHTPYAIGTQPTEGVVSFPTYQAALNFCHRYQEDISLGIKWEWNNADIEWYPERNVWYLEEISRLTHDFVYAYSVGGEAHVGVFLKAEYCKVHRPTMDEAIATLYETVSQLVQQPQHV